MESIPAALINQVPDLVALLIIVFVFVKYLEKRDQQYMQMVSQLSKDIQDLGELFKIHASETTSAIQDMRRTVAREAKLNEAVREQARAGD